MGKMPTNRLVSTCNAIYHNLRLARHSINELNYLLNHPLDSALFVFAGFPHFYFGHLIDIHIRNATILLHSLIKGELSITKLINVCEENVDNINFKLPNKEMLNLIGRAKELIEEQKAKHWSLLSASRDKFAGHQDKINAGPIKEIGEITFPLSDMLELLPNLEQAFAYIYYPLTGEKYGQLPDDSFINKAIHAMYEKKMRELEGEQE